MLELCEVLDGPMLEQNPEKKKNSFFWRVLSFNVAKCWSAVSIANHMWGDVGRA